MLGLFSTFKTEEIFSFEAEGFTQKHGFKNLDSSLFMLSAARS
jgi:hypothetical protein